MATTVNHGRLTKIIYLLHSRNSLLDARILEIFRRYVELWPILSQISFPLQRVSRGKIRLAAFNGPTSKTPYRRKNLADISYTDRVIANFVPNYVAMAMGSVVGKCDWLHSMAHLRKFPYKCKNLADISYANRAIANFVPNFVAVATGVSRGKMRLAAFDGPSPKTPYRCKNLAKIPYTSRVIANFVLNFVAMAIKEGPW